MTGRVGHYLTNWPFKCGPLRNPSPHQGSLGFSSVSNGVTTDYFSFDIFNGRHYSYYDLSVHTSIGWESLEPKGGQNDEGISAFLSLTRVF